MMRRSQPRRNRRVPNAARQIAAADASSACDPCAGLGCDEGSDVGIVGIAGFDSFKGISDGNT